MNAKKEWKSCKESCSEWLNGAKAVFNNGKLGGTIFMLHEAVGAKLACMIRLLFKDKVHVTGLENMARLTLLLTPEIWNGLKPDNDERKELFKLLQMGHSESICDCCLRLNRDDILSLINRVELVLKTIDVVYRRVKRRKLQPHVVRYINEA